MLIKQKETVQLPINKVLKENGDMIAHLRDHPEELWDRQIKNFEGSEIKYKNWCKKSYLGPRGPKKAQPRKYKRAMEYFENNKENILTESLQYEDILSMSPKELIARNNGKLDKTLQELNSLMSMIQGTEDEKERKAYFKAKKFYEQIVKQMNNSKPE